MNSDILLISVFTHEGKNLRGNISPVVLLDSPLTTAQMQYIATDLNQPATTFLSTSDQAGLYHARFFAPDEEIELCGHGSMAAMAFLARIKKAGNAVLQTKGGKIILQTEGDNQCSISLNAIPVVRQIKTNDLFEEALGMTVLEHYSTANKNIIVVEDADALAKMKPDFAKLRESDIFGYAITAKAKKDVDFVSRTLVPHVLQLEDHATGSSHAALVPYWAKRLGKKKLKAIQLSPRGGYFQCQLVADEQVSILGNFNILAEINYKLIR